MQKHIGLWIDHKKALIVTFDDNGEDITQVNSNHEKHGKFRGGAHAKTPYGAQFFGAEDQYDRHVMEQFNKYYDEVIACIQSAESVMIFGPGEAKFELQKRMRLTHPNLHIASVETLDKLTDRQFAAKARERLMAQAA
jgi:hypothetical protein